MPFIAFFAKNKYVALCRLTRAMTLGRSLDCQIFVPDVFVSRQHCRFEPTPAGWAVTDLGSANGICVDGLRVARHLMREGDIVEIGTIAVEFHEGSPGDDAASSTAPFGAATPVSELVDTVFAQGLRPVDFSRQALRKDLWAIKVTGEEAAIIDEEGAPLLPGRYPDEWVELDIEWQLADNTLYTDSRIRGEWEWTELDLDLEYGPTPPAPTPEEGLHAAPRLLELDDSEDDSAVAALAFPAPAPAAPLATRSLSNTIDDAVRQYDRDHSPPQGPAKTWHASGYAPSLRERARNLLEDFRDSDLVARLRESPRHWIGLVAVLALLIYVGMWTLRQVNRPPTRLSDGKPNPAYFNGDDHS